MEKRLKEFYINNVSSEDQVVTLTIEDEDGVFIPVEGEQVISAETEEAILFPSDGDFEVFIDGVSQGVVKYYLNLFKNVMAYMKSALCKSNSCLTKTPCTGEPVDVVANAYSKLMLYISKEAPLYDNAVTAATTLIDSATVHIWEEIKKKEKIMGISNTTELMRIELALLYLELYRVDEAMEAEEDIPALKELYNYDALIVCIAKLGIVIGDLIPPPGTYDFDQNNFIRVVNIATGDLEELEITEASIAQYVNDNGLDVTAKEIIAFDIESLEDTYRLDPNVPIDLSIVDGSITASLVELEWDINGDDALINYTVYYSTEGNAQTQGTEDLSTTLVGLNPGAIYQAFVRGYDALGNFKSSNTVTFKTLEVYSDDIPVLNHTDVTSSTIGMEWSIEEDFNATSYELYRDNVLVYSGPDTFFMSINLESDTEYTFHLFAFNGTTSSQQSNVVVISTTAEVPVLPAPILSVLNIAQNSADLLINYDNTLPIYGYTIYYRVFGTGTWALIPVNTDSIQALSALQVNTTYEVYVVANGSTINSPASNTEVFTTAQTAKLGIYLSVTSTPYTNHIGTEVAETPSNVYTDPVFPTGINIGDCIRIYIKFNASGLIAYEAIYDEHYVSTGAYNTMEEWFQAEVNTLGVWGDTYTSDYGFDSNKFYVKADRNGTPASPITTTVLVERFASGKLELIGGGNAGTADLKVHVQTNMSGGFGGGVYFTNGPTLTLVNGVAAATYQVNLDNNGEYSDSFVMSKGRGGTSFQVTGGLLASTSPLDANKLTDQVTYIKG